MTGDRQQLIDEIVNDATQHDFALVGCGWKIIVSDRRDGTDKVTLHGHPMVATFARQYQRPDGKYIYKLKVFVGDQPASPDICYDHGPFALAVERDNFDLAAILSEWRSELVRATNNITRRQA